jgi:cytochrome P450
VPEADFHPLVRETFTSFHEEFAELRDRCPVARSDAWNGFSAVLRYDDVVAVAGDPDLFTTTVQNVVPKVAFTGRRPPLHLDPPEHTPYRRALNPYFRPEKIAAFDPKMREIVGGLLEPLVEAGGGDICAEFTHRLPGYVFAQFFNLTPELGMRIREATREFVGAVQRFDMEATKATTRSRMTHGRSAFPTGSSIEAMPMSRWQVVVSDRPMVKVLRRSILSML